MSRRRSARRSVAARLGTAVVAAALAACAGDSGPPPAVPLQSTLPRAFTPRPPTTTSSLLELAPPGADLLVELDLARVRGNPVVGELFAALVAEQPSLGLTRADLVLIASYSLGGSDARTLTLLRGDDVPSPGPMGLRIDDRTVAIGQPEVIRALGTEPGAPSVADDKELLGLRDWAMPKGAQDASVRITARLDFEARVELSSLLELDSVPRALSVWGDVIDDLAVVGLIAGDDENDAEELGEELEGVAARLAADPRARGLRLSYLLRNLTVERRGRNVRALFLIAPRRLELVARRLARAVEKTRDENQRDAATQDAETVPDAAREPAPVESPPPTTESL